MRLNRARLVWVTDAAQGIAPSTGHSSVRGRFDVTLVAGTSVQIEGDVSLAVPGRVMMTLRG